MESKEHNLNDPKESIRTPEIPDSEWETLILLQRHGRYDNRRPNDPEQLTEDEKEKLGRLTPEGKTEVIERTRERIGAILARDPEHTDFLLMNSPTFWLDDERLGQRARETAEIVAEEVTKQLKEKGLSETQLLNLAVREGTPAFKGGVSRPEKRLGEALMFQVPEFTQFLREEYGGQGVEFWKNFFRDTHKEKREEAGAEGPVEIADRMSEFLNVVARFSRMYHRKHPGRKLVPWIVAHGESLEPYIQRVLGVPEEDFSTGYGDGIGISVNADGHASTRIKDREYEIPFVTHVSPKIPEVSAKNVPPAATLP